MPFSLQERNLLLAVKGVGPTVITRLEQMGISTLGELASRSAETICVGAAAVVGSSCWKNSPQARKAVTAAIEVARMNCKSRGSTP
jgi:predicted RecB family nuclease